MYSDSEDEGLDCPLCMEELDIADKNFRPCPCGYKICRFCWHHIRENLNGRCPACRREYSDQNAEFEPISHDEIQRIRREKKEKERQQKDMETANRRHLANMRVVQKNLVYIIGLHPKLATEETIRSQDYFGQFGKIAKIVINKRQIAPTSHANGATSMQPSAAVYVTYVKKEDAGKAIHAVDGSVMAGRILRASYGTTKYCTYYLRNMTCPNPNCLYLHEPGEDADTISKEELATGKHKMRDQMAHDNSDDEENHYQNYNNNNSPSSSTVSEKKLEDERSALPATASWGKSSSTSSPGTPVTKNSALLSSTSTQEPRALTPDAFGPSLAVAVAQQQQNQQQKQPLSPTVLKRKLEKKKRKEALAKQRKAEEEAAAAAAAQASGIAAESSESSPPTAKAEKSKKEEVPVEEKASSTSKVKPKQVVDYMKYDGLVNFVLGDAFSQICPPTSYSLEEEEDEEPCGVSGLYDTNSSEEGSSSITQPLTPELEKLSFNDTSLSPLEFLLSQHQSSSQQQQREMYTGTFNPFAHQLLRSVTSPSSLHSSLMGGVAVGSNTQQQQTQQQQAQQLFDSPPAVRKTSRFGFAQF